MPDSVENGKLVQRFDYAIRGSNIDQIAQLVRQLLTDRAWENFVFPNMVRNEHNTSLGQFLTAEPLQGLGFKDVKAIDALIKKACDPDLYADWHEAMKRKHGGDRKSEEAQIKPDNVSLDSGYGNSQSYTLSRLKNDHPKLFAKVVAGELSANAAAIKAGFRKTATPYQQLEKLILKLRGKLTAAERRRLSQQLLK
jgi:hypothetical protein